MKHPLFVFAGMIVLVAGTSLLHCEAEAQAWRSRLAAQHGQMAAQVKGLLEDKVASLTGGWVGLGEERRQRANEYRIAAEKAETAGNQRAWWVALALTTMALVSLATEPEKRAASLAVTALGSWMLGILLPVMSLRVQAPVEGLGMLVLRDETKSLVSVLGSLLESGKLVMLITVGGFGVVVPLIKSLCQMSPSHFHEARRLGGCLSRWSLVDVLVVSLAVFMLGSKGDVETDIQTGLGFWFFLAAAVLSIVSGFIHPKVSPTLKSQNPTSQPFHSGTRW